MDESFNGWLCFLVLLLVWKCGKSRAPWFLQWYCGAGIAIFIGICHSVIDLALYDILGTYSLTETNLQISVPDLHEGTQESLELPGILRYCAMGMPFVGLIAVFLSLIHVITFVLAKEASNNKHEAKLEDGSEPLKRNSKVQVQKIDSRWHDRVGMIEFITPEHLAEDEFKFRVAFEGKDGLTERDWLCERDLKHYVVKSNPWSLNEVDELVLLVIIMPAFFMVMATYSLIRKLQIFLGSSFVATQTSWDDYVNWRQSTYSIDLACAAAFQYFTVAAFAKLCSGAFGLDALIEQLITNELELRVDYNKLAGPNRDKKALEFSQKETLQKENDHHVFALNWAGLQGILAYILVGFFRSICAIATAVMVELKFKGIEEQWLKLSNTLQPVFGFTSALCIYNWFVIQKLPDVIEAFEGTPTRKFLAVRLLILCGDFQKTFLQVIGSHPEFLNWGFRLSSHQVDLIQTLLLILECSFVIVWNFWYWRDTRGFRIILMRAGSRVGAAAIPLLS
jgi:hypothetical protein